MPKTIMLVGAPEISKWTESDLTVRGFLPAFQRVIDEDFAHHAQTGEDYESVEMFLRNSLDHGISWRSVALEEEDLHTGWSQADWIDARPYVPNENVPRVPETTTEEEAELSFLTSMGGSCEMSQSLHDQEDVESSELSQHLEESFALHDQAPSSQVTPAVKTPLLQKQLTYEAKQTHGGKTASDVPSSPASVEATLSSPKSSVDPKTPLNGKSHFRLPYLADLSMFPSASMLRSLEPQTVTFDILVSIMSVAPSRTVKIRRTGQDIDLIEALVGDETRAGFSITFWLAEPGKNSVQDNMTGLRPVVESLRPGDVVGMRNVALGHFKGRVHGQSLGTRGKVGWETQVFRIDQMHKTTRVRPGTSTFEAKLQRVRAWSKNFVRPTGTNTEQSRAKRRKIDVDSASLPADETQ